MRLKDRRYQLFVGNLPEGQSGVITGKQRPLLCRLPEDAELSETRREAIETPSRENASGVGNRAQFLRTTCKKHSQSHGVAPVISCCFSNMHLVAEWVDQFSCSSKYPSARSSLGSAHQYQEMKTIKEKNTKVSDVELQPSAVQYSSCASRRPSARSVAPCAVVVVGRYSIAEAQGMPAGDLLGPALLPRQCCS